MKLKITVSAFCIWTLLAGISVPVLLPAQLQWPAVNNTMKPWTRWWWQGSAVDKTNLLYNLEEYKRAGLGGVEITPIYGIKGEESKFIPFLSPQWMDMLVYTIEQSKKLGLGVDLANGTGWPFGGPWVSENNASKTIYHKVFELKGGETLQQNIVFDQPGMVRTANNKTLAVSALSKPVQANKNQQELSLDQLHYPEQLQVTAAVAYAAHKQPVILTSMIDEKGKLNWRAPEGNWKIFALFEGLHGKMVERAAPGGEGYAIDHFSHTATPDYLRRFDSAFKGYNISGIRSFFNDSYEVDDARGQSNWTPEFFKEFSARKKYDLRTRLPALFGLDSPMLNSQVLFDYRSVIDELLLENFTIAWKKWAASKGAWVRNQSHGSPANTLDLYAVVDIPETEGNDVQRFKFASSAANVTGKKLVSAESATWLNEHFLSNWSDVKKAVDLFFLGGINHIFYHGTAYSPKAAPWPGWLFYAAVHFQPVNPMWKDFHVLNSYITRTQSMLQNSKPDNDLLVYYPIADQYAKTGTSLLQHFDGMEKNFEETDFKMLADWMFENDYSYDFFSTRQLQQFRFNNKIITGGNSYQAILLPGNKYITAAELRKLLDLCKAGATIIAYNNLPSIYPGFANNIIEQQQIDSMLATIRFTNNGNSRSAKIGKGLIITGNEVGSLLRTAGIRNEKLHAGGLSFIRKTNQDGHMYFVTNNAEKSFDDWISFSALNQQGSAAIFDPMTGNNGMAPQRKSDGNEQQCLLRLAAGESALIQIYSTKKTGKSFPYFEKSGAATEIKGEWTLSFIDGGPQLPAERKLGQPALWTGSKDSASDSFSGLAKYTVNFAAPGVGDKNVDGTKTAGADNTGAKTAGSKTGLKTGGSKTAGLKTAGSKPEVKWWQLNLGKVHETAEVFLNGKSIASLIGPSYTVNIPASALLPQNKLEIIVANLMANRIIYMDQHAIPWKIFYNTNMPARKKENVVDGLFNASKWNPLPSGIAGPVTITPMQVRK